VGGGTSFAAPQVAGLVALLISHRPGMSPEGIIEHLRRTATPVSGGPENWAGAGLVDMLRALSPQFRLGVPGTARD
jgi:subtilisin family serine protease